MDWEVLIRDSWISVCVAARSFDQTALKREAENEAITFNGISFSSSKQLATKFNQQFNTSKLGRPTSSREIRVVTRENQEETIGDGANIHRGPSNESNQEL